MKTTELFDDDAIKIADESLKLETTVSENLEYSLDSLIKYWDIVAQKDSSNANANADIVVNGKILVANVPSTTLLGMEKKLNELRNLFNAIPTLPPGRDWVIDESHEKKGVYKDSNPVETLKTQNDIEFREISPATVQHKAQIAEISVKKDIGRFVTTKWSGMLTPYDKATYITRLETLLSAVKKARQRANEVETVDIKIGQALVDYIVS